MAAIGFPVLRSDTKMRFVLLVRDLTADRSGLLGVTPYSDHADDWEKNNAEKAAKDVTNPQTAADQRVSNT